MQSEESRASGERTIALIRKVWSPPAHFFHLKSGGHLAACRTHLNSSVFARLDLGGFFSTVTKNKIIRALAPKIGYEKAREVATDSVVALPAQSGSQGLPFGFVQSPILASIVLDRSRLGSELRQLRGQKKIKISVYMDDILISGNSFEDVDSAFQRIRSAIEISNFSVNKNKIQYPSDSFAIFNLIGSKSSLKISEDRMAQFRSDLKEATNPRVMSGVLAYVKSVNRAQLAELK